MSLCLGYLARPGRFDIAAASLNSTEKLLRQPIRSVGQRGSPCGRYHPSSSPFGASASSVPFSLCAGLVGFAFATRATSPRLPSTNETIRQEASVCAGAAPSPKASDRPRASDQPPPLPAFRLSPQPRSSIAPKTLYAQSSRSKARRSRSCISCLSPSPRATTATSVAASVSRIPRSSFRADISLLVRRRAISLIPYRSSMRPNSELTYRDD
jgi:hypothetical protein